MVKAGVVTFGLVNFLYLGYLLACGIVWLLIGADNLDHACVRKSDGDPNIAVWLVVMGSVNLGAACIQILLLPCMLRAGVRQKFPGGSILVLLFFPFSIAVGLFQVAWLITGAVRLHQSPCQDFTAVYKTTLAAIIIGFVMNSMSFCLYPGKNDDD